MGILVKTENGTIRGTTSTDYDNQSFYCFYGVPYAKPPIGHLRFKAPEKLENWTGIKDCTKIKEGCISRHNLTFKLTGSEDCLFLNIYTKHLPTQSKNNFKPVLVWVHGGAFVTGSGNPDQYGPEFLITQDIVIVTITYRLHSLGFLCLEDESLEVPGNAGVKDALMALQWINKNIENFNGDPSNVTLASQSGGTGITHCLLLTPLTKNLFHKAIFQSGTGLHEFALGRRNSALQLAEMLGFKSECEHEVLEFLRSVPAIDLLKGYEKLHNIKEDLYINCAKPFQLAVEKLNPRAILTELPVVATMKYYNNVPLLMGYTNQEGLYTLSMIKKLKVIIDDFENMVPYSLKLERGSPLSKLTAKKIQEFFFGNEIATDRNKEKYMRMMSALFLKYPVYRAAKYFLKNSNCPIYFYQFSVDTKLNLYKNARKCDLPGACHSDDLCYLFKNMMTPEVKPGTVEDLNIRRMTKIWGHFIKTGNPNCQNDDPLIQVDWKPLQPDVFHYVDIRNDGLVADINPDKGDMSFCDEIYQVDPAYRNHKL